MSESRIRKKTHIQTEFGKRLRGKRKELDFTLEVLAEKSGLTSSYIGSVERGERNISLGNIVAIAEALMISPKDLIPDSHQSKMPAKIEFGKRLRGKRQELDLTQAMLAEKANLNTSDIDLFERGEGTINFETIMILAEALKLSPKELFPEMPTLSKNRK